MLINNLHNHRITSRLFSAGKCCIQYIVFSAVLILFSCPAFAQPTEYILKAAFLEKFARFTDWPDQTFEQKDSAHFIISVVGKSPFDGSLEKLYKKEKIKSRPVKIKYIQNENQIPGTHLLFIAKSEKKRLNRILDKAAKHSVLVVSDTRGFAEKGSHINLYITPQGTLHFEINHKASKQAGLKIQVILLEIAKIVGGR